ncbi:MAG: hypothetical protein HQK79_20410 [Desulfobacterales bacterium]|nr:hypothetical protein [Desulfobacterales bacterium]
MKAILKVVKNDSDYRSDINFLMGRMEADNTCEITDSDNRCFCMRCRLGAGQFWIQGEDAFEYLTGSGKGRYIFSQEKIIFIGYRNSFKDGTEFFHPRDFEDYGVWEILESSEPRNIWE